MANLSKPQAQVIEMMKQGWELGESLSISISSGPRLQEGGIGSGGATCSVASSTVGALLARKLIRRNRDRFPMRTYKLTEQV